jgi:hypothetical protein
MKCLKSLSVILATLFVLTSCRNETRDVNFKYIYRYWSLSEALRNGRPTETLTGTYFHFTEDGKVKTNLTVSGMEESYDFEMNGNKIELNSQPEKVVYAVEELSDSTLSLAFNMRNVPFRLKLVKGDPSATYEVNQ